MLSSHRLPCLAPGCPSTFKSQHGRTYHFRVFHTNSNLQSNPRQQESTLKLPQVPQQQGSKRIEHPHLTGKCFLHIPSSMNITDIALTSPSLRRRWELPAAWGSANTPSTRDTRQLDPV
jgi:hypothetical protein